MNRSIPKEMRQAVLERDKYTCRYCGSTTPPFHIDHVYPFSKGGITVIENLVTACRSCNGKKSNKIGWIPSPILKHAPVLKQSTSAGLWLIVIGISIVPFGLNKSIAFLGFQSFDIIFAGSLLVILGAYFQKKGI